MVEPALAVANLSVKLANRTLLSNINFSAMPGTITGIIGPNGAGKSTLIKAILGLLPAIGKISVVGMDSTKLSILQRARHISYVPQFSLLTAPIAVQTVVAQGRFMHRSGLGSLNKEDKIAITDAIKAADIENLQERRFSELSYGEKRRVLIARALATNAQIILLDEPTAALDLAHALTLLTLLKKMAQAGRCIITVLHSLDEILTLADHTLIIANGKLAINDTTKAVFSSPRLSDIFGVELIPGGGLGYRLYNEAK
ncbi:MAG: ABC transporter ATP-binding protein [Deltaproteobacteria bacterium]|nr:ABC transporter ATP-binding protein [Deltaproteobacteria bacterium]